MKIKVLLSMALALCLMAPVAQADTLQGSAKGAWTGIGAITLGTSGNPFWNNRSADGNPPGNVGYILTGLPNLPSQDWQFWSIPATSGWWLFKNTTYNVDNNVVFNKTGNGNTETLIITVAGNAGDNILYAYNTADPTETTLLFSGVTNTPQTITKDIPYSQYGFLLEGPGGTFYSGDKNGAESSDWFSNFAFFQNTADPGSYYFGVEDQASWCNFGNEGLYGDYNDLVVKVSDNPAPLPGALLLLGAGLLRLEVYARRKRTLA